MRKKNRSRYTKSHLGIFKRGDIYNNWDGDFRIVTVNRFAGHHPITIRFNLQTYDRKVSPRFFESGGCEKITNRNGANS